MTQDTPVSPETEPASGAHALPATPGPSAAPGILRHEGAHRVTVAPGAHSALSTAAPTAGPRLRPRAGPIPPSLLAKPPASATQESALPRRSATASPSGGTQVSRGPDRTLRNSRWLPPQPETAQAEKAGSDLQQRLDRLAKVNAETSHQVAALEREIKATASTNRSLS